MTVAQELTAEHEAQMHADTVIGCPLCASELFEALDVPFVDMEGIR
jgi:hypothetical protein